jgi:hypothetical protein
MNKAIKIAIGITLSLWFAGSIGCSTLERVSQGLHEDIKAYNDGNAARRGQQ